ncbi:hypothetical protein HPP92_023701 [Vanilla planifolia]|uniref:Uncharacterized protein n=1 Tax=Vanilla planifolia TaxID=51239 RepID=A0A835PRC6_VANPL|nr:hypothetical protein HPP92_023701 [Vanilla planifolia]
MVDVFVNGELDCIYRGTRLVLRTKKGFGLAFWDRTMVCRFGLEQVSKEPSSEDSPFTLYPDYGKRRRRVRKAPIEGPNKKGPSSRAKKEDEFEG